MFKSIISQRLVRYLISGGTGAAVDFGLLFALTDWLGLWYLASAVIAFVVAFGVSFVLQKLWTFRDRATDRVKRQLAFYLAVALANLVLNTALVFVFVEYAGLYYLFAQFLAAGLIAVSSFFIYRRLIFASPLRSAAGS